MEFQRGAIFSPKKCMETKAFLKDMCFQNLFACNCLMSTWICPVINKLDLDKGL